MEKIRKGEISLDTTSSSSNENRCNVVWSNYNVGNNYNIVNNNHKCYTFAPKVGNW